MSDSLKWVTSYIAMPTFWNVMKDILKNLTYNINN